MPRKSKKPGPSKKITARQLSFIDHYLIDPSSVNAAKAAGYAHPGVSGSRLLDAERYPLVAAEVERRRAVLAERLEVKAETVTRELARIGFFNAKRLIKADGSPMTLAEMPDDLAAAVSDIDVVYGESPDEEGVFNRFKRMKVRFYSKLDALKQLADHLGLSQRPQQTNVNVLGFDWERLLSPRPLMGPEHDPVEAEIVAMESLALSSHGDTRPPAEDRGPPKPSANGTH